MKCPDGIYNFVVALYEQCDAYIHDRGHSELMCLIQSGVLQGCPLASLLFVVCMEPFCILFHVGIDNMGIVHVRLCADGIGVILQNWAHLIKLLAMCP